MDAFLTYNVNYSRLLKMNQKDVINEGVRRGFISAIHAPSYTKYTVERLARFIAESIAWQAKG